MFRCQIIVSGCLVLGACSHDMDAVDRPTDARHEVAADSRADRNPGDGPADGKKMMDQIEKEGGADAGLADVGGADVGGADVGLADVGGADVGGADMGGADSTAPLDLASPPTKWSTVQNLPVTGSYTAVAALNNYVLVGDGQGTLLHSKDSGKTFSAISSLGAKVVGIALDGSTGVAVTSKGAIYRSFNTNFATWGKTDSCGQSAWAAALQGKVAVVVGAGIRCVSGDGGITFTEELVKVAGNTAYLRSVAVASVKGQSVVLAVGYDTTPSPVLLRSDDGGTKWTDLSGALNSPGISLYAVALVPGGQAIIGGAKGNVFLSTDGGLKWNGTNIGGAYRNHHAVTLRPPLALMGGGTINSGAYLSSNSGSYFTLINLPPVTTARIGAVALDSQGNAFLAGDVLIRGTP